MQSIIMPLMLGAWTDTNHFTERNNRRRFTPPRNVIHSPKKELREFDIKGNKILAYSRKDAIKRLKHRKA